MCSVVIYINNNNSSYENICIYLTIGYIVDYIMMMKYDC